MNEKSLKDNIHNAFVTFSTPTYNFKHLDKLELKVNSHFKEAVQRLKKEVIGMPNTRRTLLLIDEIGEKEE